MVGCYRFGRYFAHIAEQLQDADLTVVNVEGSMGGMGDLGYTGYPSFNTPPSLLSALKACGVDMLTLANNHSLDEYFDGLKGTMDNCDKYGLAFVGAARTRQERETPVVKEIEGISVGFLNYTMNTNGMEKYCSEDAVQFGIWYARNASFKRDVAALRGAGADVVVAYMHWGTEYELKPDSSQKSLARRLTEAGVDVIIGSHPHVVQKPIEWLSAKLDDGSTHRCLCVYSLGNFLSNQPRRLRDSGIVFEFTIQETRENEFEITSPRYIPTYYWRRGSETKGLTIRIVSVGEWLDKRPEGMDDDSYGRLKQVWRQTRELLGEKVAVMAAN